MLKENEILLSTNDRELFDDLHSANIEGMKISQDIRKYGDSMPWDLVIALLPAAFTFFAEWIWKYLMKSPTKKTTINEKPIPNQVNNIIILLKQETNIYNATTDQKKDKPK